ncbi:MAG: dihydroorotase [Bacteroidales bacterium]
MSSVIIRNGTIVNEGKSRNGDLLIIDDRIAATGNIDHEMVPRNALRIDAEGMLVLPGIIDDHVHLREPGLTGKGDIFSETRAAVAGGITSLMDMPNTFPPTTTIRLLNEKFSLGRDKSLVNYSYYLGATETNSDEVLNADPETVCGIKVFLGASTGDLLLNDEKILRKIFSHTPLVIACHCEDELIIGRNINIYREKYGENIPAGCHPLIRSRDACLQATTFITKLAREYNTRLHILHLSTADEVRFLSDNIPLSEKKITCEACIHHLWFDDSDYERLGNLIKWNPAIKTRFDRESLIKGLNNNNIDVVGTDHAPHTIDEKRKSYFKAPSGGPMLQHSLVAMMELCHKGLMSPEKVVEKMCHNPALIFRIKNRGFIREGYKADICILNPDNPWTVERKNILYRCGWSPFEGVTFRSRVEYTIVNGNIIYNKGIINEQYRGEKLLFNTK